MATKLFKRNTAADVFDQIIDDATVPNVETPVDTTGVTESPDPHGPDEEPHEADAQPLTPFERKRWPLLAAIVTGGAIVVAAVGALVFLGWQYKQHNDEANAGRAALDTAMSYAATLTSIDTNGVDDNFTKVLSGATGEFKDMYSQSASQLRQVLIDNKAMSKGVVVDAAVKSVAKNKVEVLLFVDQSITNAVNPDPRVDRSRVAMTMELVNGRWLASSVDLK